MKHKAVRRAGLRIALVGTRGVPAHYGGFETCVEEVGRRLAERGHLVTVYCRSGNGIDTASRNTRGCSLCICRHSADAHSRL